MEEREHEIDEWLKFLRAGKRKLVLLKNEIETWQGDDADPQAAIERLRAAFGRNDTEEKK